MIVLFKMFRIRLKLLLSHTINKLINDVRINIACYLSGIVAKKPLYNFRRYTLMKKCTCVGMSQCMESAFPIASDFSVNPVQTLQKF